MPSSPKRHPYNQWSPDARALDRVGDKWTMLIIRDLADGPRRFVDLQRTLPGISTEQLRSRLNRMVDDGLLTRERFREVPPRVDYALTPSACDLLPAITAIARWGYRHAWGDADDQEHIDVSAVLRAMVGGLAFDADATIDCIVLGTPSGELRVRIAADGGRARLTRTLDGEPTAAIMGDERAWRDALTTGGDLGRLQLAGDRAVARSALEQICCVEERDRDLLRARA